MAESGAILPADSTGKALRTNTQTTTFTTGAGGVVHQQVVALADPTTPANLAGVTAGGELRVLQSTLPAGTNMIGSVNPDTLGSSTALGALNAAATVTLNGQAGITLAITGTWVGTLSFEAQYPDGSWISATAYTTGDVGIQSTASNVVLRAPSFGWTAFRARMSSYTSGSASVRFNASYSPQPLPVAGLLTDGGTFADARSGTVIMGRTAGSGPTAVAKQAIVDASGNLVVHDLKDVSRTPVVLSAAGVASVTTVGLMTLNQYVGGTVSSVSTYTVPAGKTFRIQSIQFGVRFTTPSTTVTFASTTFAVRFVTTGTTVVGSPILHQDSKLAASNTPTPNSDMAIPEGLELPAGYNIGVTHLASAAVLSEDVAIVGYLY